jgi:hypothetical protein
MLGERSAGLKLRRRAHEGRVQDPGLARHEWESEMQALEDQLSENPAEALPELDALIERMLEEAGYAIDDPVVRSGDEREIVAEYLAAHEITVAAEAGSDQISPGDVAAAINGFRALFDYIVTERSAGDLSFKLDDE